MANDGMYAAYETTGYKTGEEGGLAAAFDEFHAAVTKAYVDCMKAGLGGSQDFATQIDALATGISEAIHSFYLSAKIDTDITVVAGQPMAVPPGAIPDAGPIAAQTGKAKGHLE